MFLAQNMAVKSGCLAVYFICRIFATESTGNILYMIKQVLLSKRAIFRRSALLLFLLVTRIDYAQYAQHKQFITTLNPFGVKEVALNEWIIYKPQRDVIACSSAFIRLPREMRDSIHHTTWLSLNKYKEYIAKKGN